MSQAIVDVPVAAIAPSGLNPRIINEKAPAFRELVDSVRAHGVIIPIHLRPDPNADGYELLAGERRWRAAAWAELPSIPAIVHEGLSDVEAFEITFHENYLREDLTPIEEGKAVHLLFERYQGDVRAVAAKLGRSPTWVATHRRIHDGLNKQWVKALAGGALTRWTSAHLAQIARLPEETQQGLATEMLRPHWRAERWDGASVKDLEQEIAGRLRLLRKAPWPLDDATMPGNACVDCTRRSSAQPLLWHDDIEDAAVAKDDRCLDAACWAVKQAEAVKRAAALARQEHGDKLLYVTGADSYADDGLRKQYGRILNKRDCKAAKRSDRAARPALVVSGRGAGKVRWVKANAWVLRDDRKTKRTDPQTGKAVPKSLPKRRDELDRKRWAQVIAEVRAAMERSYVEMIVIPPGAPNIAVSVMAAAAIMGIVPPHEDDAGRWKTVLQVLADPKAHAQIQDRLWRCVRQKLSDELHSQEGVTQTSDWRIELCKHLAAFIGLDAEALFAEVSTRKGFTEPTSWAGLQPDGTPSTQGNASKASRKGAKAQRTEAKKASRRGAQAQRTDGTKPAKAAKSRKKRQKAGAA